MKGKKAHSLSAPSWWPKAIRRSQRYALDAHRSFLFHHQPLWESEHYDELSIELSGNLLAVVVRGRLVLRRGRETQVVREGDACLLSAGPVIITEVPRSTASSAEIVYVFFDDRAVRGCFNDLARTERMSLAMAAPPTELPCLANFVAKALPFLLGSGGEKESDLSHLLKMMFFDGWGGAWMFLKGFFARRRALHLYLEKCVFPLQSVAAVVGGYPAGQRQFRRDFRAQYDLSLQEWLEWRRLEVARLKVRYEKTLSVEQIAAAAGYRNFQRFRQQFRHRFRLWPEEIYRRNSREELSARELAPFWHWAYAESFHRREASHAFINRAHIAQYRRRERRRLKHNDLIRLGHSDDEPCAWYSRPPPRAEVRTETPDNVIPFDSSGFEEFLGREISLDPTELCDALVA